MKRVIKKPEIRKCEIIDAAKVLFSKKGYTATSVEDIIEKSKIAKGTFYYYFKSKKELLAELVKQIANDMKSYFQSIVDIKNMSAVEKLRIAITGSRKKSNEQSSVMKTIHSEENRELQEKLNIQTIKEIAPILSKIIEQGNKDDEFKANYPEEITQLLMASSLFVFDSGLFNWSNNKEKKLLKAFQFLFESFLNVNSETLNFISSKK